MPTIARVIGFAMDTARRLAPPMRGRDIVTATLPLATFDLVSVDDSLEVEIVVALGFVTLAFLLAARLLIRDFFSIDMWRSLNFVLDFCWRTFSDRAKQMPNRPIAGLPGACQ
jgi:hypothetical protein